VITRVFDPSSGIKIGDVLLEIDGVPIQHYRDSIRKWTPGSNPPSVERNINDYVVHSKQVDAILVIDDGTATRTIAAKRSYNPTQYYDSIYANPNPIWYKLQGNVGYVDMGRLTVDMVENMYDDLKSTKAIVFDVRNYPNGTMYEICKRILPEAYEFMKFTSPDPHYPGSLLYNENGYYCGPDISNPDWFKGQVFILFNEETQSHAEFTIMALETHPNALKVGSQTAGADGNVMRVNLPTSIGLYYTGLGIYYPDWSETQRIGIVPDVEVRPTIKGIKEGRDEVLESALAKLGVESLTSFSPIENVFPNPFNNVITVSMSTIRNPSVEVCLYDVLGRKVYSSTVVTSGTGDFQIQMDDRLTSGSYLLRIISDDLYYSQIMVKQ
jgi:C-terminal processing protease CtpA/Prc